MARTPVEERLEKMREDERKLRERRKALEARVSTERRKAETRERIMLGAFILQPRRGYAHRSPARAPAATRTADVPDP